MTDAEFLKWFMGMGHKWRGYPSWINGAWHKQLMANPLHRGFHVNLSEDSDVPMDDYDVDNHEAACLVRDFLIFQDEMPSFLTGSRFMMNTKIVAAVEAQMAEEKKEKP